MAVNTVLRAIISIFAIGISMVAFMPAVYDLYYNQDLWDTAPAEALAVRDNIYATFLSLPTFQPRGRTTDIEIFQVNLLSGVEGIFLPQRN